MKKSITDGGLKMFNLNFNEMKLLRSCRHGPKVLETTAGEIIKIFYTKKRKIFSSTLFKSYAKRFCMNAERLSALEIKVPIIKDSYFCSQSNAHFISYNKLEGMDVFSIVSQGNDHILYDVVDYVSQLHAKGIFFRAIHLSNLLHQGFNQFELLDITDLKILKKPLSLYMRYRNLKHLFLHKEDKIIWKKKGIKYWLEVYCRFSVLSFFSRKGLVNYFFYKHLRS